MPHRKNLRLLCLAGLAGLAVGCSRDDRGTVDLTAAPKPAEPPRAAKAAPARQAVVTRGQSLALGPKRPR